MTDFIGQKTVTLFGGTGFVGRYVAQMLAQRGWRIIVASRHPDRALPLKTAGAVGQVVPVFADIRDDGSVAAAVAGADAVVNLVGILFERGKQRFDSIHGEAAGRVARAAAAAGASRFVQISAIGASADSPSAYARTKAAGEAAVRAAVPGAAILRPSVIFGPEDGFFNLFAGLARTAPFLPLFGGGTTKFQPVYVQDVAAAVVACLEQDGTVGQAYELGGPRVYSFRELMELTLQQTGRKKRLVSLSWGMAAFEAKLLGLLPKPPLTPDQVVQLKIDNIVAPSAKTLADLGIQPTPAELILPSYLDRYRPGGRFGNRMVA
ncbi:complex I NDUFA9 subunit family protein [Mycobacterium sp. KBS0706]|uniref:complex I NDUFA9 subunit family protein n=1 Tax=Mycobacterium sp. KBS0706 TaxID=2578109 RepID=UPI00110FB527|nr:complex I NDUFA9 subunit family protein [Mycobacterium sp. KBS0706]TSD90112.1 complex I NDUFA9 subunit family protein [Mycobacterium sp. KBS0706]